MDVHIRALRYFVTVAEHRHVTHAAEQLKVSQPALSKQVRALESTMGTALFERDSRGVGLTAAGRALLPHATAVLVEWDAATAALAGLVDDAASTLTVGMGTAPGRGMWPAIRDEFGRIAPQVRLELRQVVWSDPTGGLADASSGVDAALVWLPLPDTRRFAWLEVAEEPRMVALPAGHRLADRDSVAFAELLDEPFLALPMHNGPLRDVCLAREHRGRRPVRVTGEIHTAEGTAASVAAGLGIVLLAAGNAAQLTRPDVAVRPVLGIGPATLALAWRRGDDRGPVAALRKAIATVVGGRDQTALRSGVVPS